MKSSSNRRINCTNVVGLLLGDSFSSKVKYTFVNGHLAYNDGVIDDYSSWKKIEFES